MRTMNRVLGFAGVAAVGMVAAPTASEAAGEFLWPVSGRITATTVYPGGWNHSYGSADIGAWYWTGIGASRYGSAYAFWPGGSCGYGANIYHASGYRALYCHMVRWPSVGGGRWVGFNQHIGYVGSTGNSTGPHVHLGILRWGVRLAIPGIWFGKWVNRGWVAARYWGL